MEKIDFLTPYLRHIFGVMGIVDLTIIDIENALGGSENLDASRTGAQQRVGALVFA